MGAGETTSEREGEGKRGVDMSVGTAWMDGWMRICTGAGSKHMDFSICFALRFVW